MPAKKETNPWWEKAIVILLLTILAGIIQDIYSKLGTCCQRGDHSALWQAIKKVEEKQTEILIKIK